MTPTARSADGYGEDLVRAPLATGLPTGDRTVEAWVMAGAPGGRLISYGGFSVALDDRALLVGDTRLELPAPITDGHWHQLDVTVHDGTLTAYLDGAPAGTASAALDTTDAGDVRAGGQGANRYDELALYPRALSPGAIAAHFAASATPSPPRPPA